MSRPLIDAAIALLATGSAALVVARVRSGLSNAATGMLLLVSAGAFLMLMARVICRTRRLERYSSHVAILVVATTLSFLGLELALRYVVKTRATYGEFNGSPVYRSVYRYDNPSWYHTYRRSGRIRDVKSEFTHERTTNALGLPERDIAEDTPAGEFRVLALGDSYTEGVGAAYDDTWVRVFERAVSPLPDGRIVKAINAGISGSDLMLQYVLFRDRLARYRPEMVIVALNNSDIADVITRGGMERFRPDGRIRGDRGPWWDWLYGISYITRHVVHDVLGRSWLLLSPDEHAAAEAVARQQLMETIDAIAALTAELGAKFVLALNPHQYEVKDGKYEPGLRPLAEELVRTRGSEVIDVLASYQRDGVLTPATSGDYYWALDFHHNARGYALMGEAIAAGVRARQVLPAGR